MNSLFYSQKKCIQKTVLFSFFIFGFCLRNVFAATVVPMDLDALVKVADTISMIETVETSTRWDSNKVYTDNAVRVIESLKGNQGDEYIITTLGGVAEHPRLKAVVDMTVPGVSKFLKGSRSIVFTRKSASGLNQLVGLSQGKFDASTDEESELSYIMVGQKKLVRKTESTIDELLFFPIEAAEHDDSINLVLQNILTEDFITIIKAKVNSSLD